MRQIAVTFKNLTSSSSTHCLVFLHPRLCSRLWLFSNLQLAERPGTTQNFSSRMLTRFLSLLLLLWLPGCAFCNQEDSDGELGKRLLPEGVLGTWWIWELGQECRTAKPTEWMSTAAGISLRCGLGTGHWFVFQR